MNLGVTDEYKPGQCNIGWKERQLRLLIAIFGFLGGLFYIAGIWILALPTWYILGVFIFYYATIVNILQFALGFCVTHGISGKQHFEEKQRVNRKTDRVRDQMRAIQIAVGTLFAAGITTGITYLVFIRIV